MNWGTKLVIALGLFISFIVVLSTKMIFSDKDDLVESDYYEKGLSYDLDYNRARNVAIYHAEPTITLGINKSIDIQFKKQATGTIKFLHASNKKLDRLYQVNTDADGNAALSLKDLSNGYWHAVLEWKSDNTSYLFKKKMHIQ
ncbi:FixH family protein [Arcticibacter eurypsychrophilus]|uniref:FixH family protein n=1 Tax=Arcticibacter eurypsychrophilus TaxID=1434752 RepID=UPI00084CE8F4|nr:FixH family protein [Arcticibacter eurypsychrophilus]